MQGRRELGDYLVAGRRMDRMNVPVISVMLNGTKTNKCWVCKRTGGEMIVAVQGKSGDIYAHKDLRECVKPPRLAVRFPTGRSQFN